MSGHQLDLSAQYWCWSGERVTVKKGGKYVKDFVEQMFKQLGMWVFILFTHWDESGIICVSQWVNCIISDGSNQCVWASHDHNEGLKGGQAFTELFPDWEMELIMEHWEQYANEQMGEYFGSSARNKTDSDCTQLRLTMTALGLLDLGHRHPYREEKPTLMSSGWKWQMTVNL